MMDERILARTLADGTCGSTGNWLPACDCTRTTENPQKQMIFVFTGLQFSIDIFGSF